MMNLDSSGAGPTGRFIRQRLRRSDHQINGFSGYSRRGSDLEWRLGGCLRLEVERRSSPDLAAANHGSTRVRNAHDARERDRSAGAQSPTLQDEKAGTKVKPLAMRGMKQGNGRTRRGSLCRNVSP